MSLPVIRTGRLVLRPWTVEDVDSLHALWTSPEVRRYLWDDLVISREVAAQVVESHLAAVQSWHRLLDDPRATAGVAGRRPDRGFLRFPVHRRWAMERIGMTLESSTPSMITYVLRAQK